MLKQSAWYTSIGEHNKYSGHVVIQAYQVYFPIARRLKYKPPGDPVLDLVMMVRMYLTEVRVT